MASISHADEPLKIEFIESERVDETGVVKKYYYAQYLTGREDTDKRALRT